MRFIKVFIFFTTLSLANNSFSSDPRESIRTATLKRSNRASKTHPQLTTRKRVETFIKVLAYNRAEQRIDYAIMIAGIEGYNHILNELLTAKKDSIWGDDGSAFWQSDQNNLETALLWVAESGNQEGVSLLLDRRFNLNLKANAINPKGETPLTFARKYKFKSDIIDELANRQTIS